jgi:hypothetical protein
MSVLTYRCACGTLLEFEPDDGDCEDDVVICPACMEETPIAEAAQRGTKPEESE